MRSAPDHPPRPHPRSVSVEGLLNLRDLGGLVGRDGQRVRPGVLYRSEAPCALVGPGLDAFTALALRTVVDLRDAGEAERTPVSVPAGARRLSAPIARVTAGGEEFDAILAGVRTSFTVDDLVAVMTRILDLEAAAFGTLCAYLADADNLPLLVHCAAGKDRTGLAVAVVLSVLGVDRAEILDDYALSTWMQDVRRAEFGAAVAPSGVDVVAVEAIISAPPEALTASLVHLDERHGSVEAYLLGPAGVSGETLDRMRALMLEET